MGDCIDCVTIIARKAIESWILADTELMRKITNNTAYICIEPENTINMPFEEIAIVLKENNAKGTGPSKPRFLKRLIKQGFDVDRAKKHQNIKSLNYFINKLNDITEN